MRKIKLLFFITLIFSSVLLNAQVKHDLIAKFESAKNVTINKANQTSTTFTLKCSLETIRAMQANVENYSSEISFKYSEDKKDKDSYDCTLIFNHIAVPMELYKPLYLMGITGLNIENKDYTLDYLLTIK